jgi:hypothetical protein
MDAQPVSARLIHASGIKSRQLQRLHWGDDIAIRADELHGLGRRQKGAHDHALGIRVRAEQRKGILGAARSERFGSGSIQAQARILERGATHAHAAF